MKYVSSIERLGFKKGESTILVRQIERKFGQVSNEVKQKIEAADSDILLEWGEKILSASTIEDVFH